MTQAIAANRFEFLHTILGRHAIAKNDNMTFFDFLGRSVSDEDDHVKCFFISI